MMRDPDMPFLDVHVETSVESNLHGQVWPPLALSASRPVPGATTEVWDDSAEDRECCRLCTPTERVEQRATHAVDRQRLSRVLVDDDQEFQAPAVVGSVVKEIVAPDVVWRLCGQPDAA